MLYLVNGISYRLIKSAGQLLLRKDAFQFDLFGGQQEVPLTSKAKQRQKLMASQPSLFDIGAFASKTPVTLKPKKAKAPKAPTAPKVAAVGKEKTKVDEEGRTWIRNDQTDRFRLARPEEVANQPATVGGLAVIQDDEFANFANEPTAPEKQPDIDIDSLINQVRDRVYLVTDWNKDVQSKAQVKKQVENILDGIFPDSVESKEEFQGFVSQVMTALGDKPRKFLPPRIHYINQCCRLEDRDIWPGDLVKVLYSPVMLRMDGMGKLNVS